MRRFQLQRTEDATGVSGTGIVAQGVEFDDGSCAMRWLTATASTAIYANIADLEAIHGHEGRTRVVWLDKPARGRHWKLSIDPEHARSMGSRWVVLNALRDEHHGGR